MFLIKFNQLSKFVNKQNGQFSHDMNPRGHHDSMVNDEERPT
jgi:hypothetical protein